MKIAESIKSFLRCSVNASIFSCKRTEIYPEKQLSRLHPPSYPLKWGQSADGIDHRTAMNPSYFSQILKRPGSILSIAELRWHVLFYCSIMHIVDWGFGREVAGLIARHSHDLSIFLSGISSSHSYIWSCLAYGGVSIRGPHLDQFTGVTTVREPHAYMFIPVVFTADPRFSSALSLLLRDEGYVRPLRDWTLETWKHFRELTIPSKRCTLSLWTPYFRTKSGLYITMLPYHGPPCAWNGIPGVCAHSAGISVITRANRKSIRLCQFYSLPCRDLTREAPIKYVDVNGHEICKSIGSTPKACETGFTLLADTYLQRVKDFKSNARPWI